MATEIINEPVTILASFRRGLRGGGIAQPEIMHWRGRRYRIARMGLRYPTHQGQRMLHRFTFVVNDTMFEVEFDAEKLTWQLTKVSDGNPD